jgi:hypothetical protein
MGRDFVGAGNCDDERALADGLWRPFDVGREAMKESGFDRIGRKNLGVRHGSYDGAPESHGGNEIETDACPSRGQQPVLESSKKTFEMAVDRISSLWARCYS